MGVYATLDVIPCAKPHPINALPYSGGVAAVPDPLSSTSNSIVAEYSPAMAEKGDMDAAAFGGEAAGTCALPEEGAGEERSGRSFCSYGLLPLHGLRSYSGPGSLVLGRSELNILIMKIRPGLIIIAPMRIWCEGKNIAAPDFSDDANQKRM